MNIHIGEYLREFLGRASGKRSNSHATGPGRRASVDSHPWEHPFLTVDALRRFREYSLEVWDFARTYAERHPRPLRMAFVVNMAQNMYNWAMLAQKAGVDVTLFPSVMDTSAINAPEWEEFDGEYPDIQDGAGFRTAHPELAPRVPCRTVPMDGLGLLDAHQRFLRDGDRSLHRLLASCPGVRPEALLSYAGLYPYYLLARELSQFDVLYAASLPLGAYLSGRPYNGFMVGGDLQWDCGRADDYGTVMSLAFNAARFLCLSNPHALGHSRRLGLTNGVYVPYPMDDSRYCPGSGAARRAWEGRCGPGVFVLSTARLDASVKGQGAALLSALLAVAQQRPNVRYVFLAWGEGAEAFRSRVYQSPTASQFLFLSPAGKRRLIDYYRSADIVLDSFVYGYYGATALEAAAAGKPVVMKLRAEHYAPLYGGDVAPVLAADTPEQAGQALLALVDSPTLRTERGQAMRDWLVRHHGQRSTLPVLLALLRLAADQTPLPPDLRSPLHDPESEAEAEYHKRCLAP